MKSILFIMLIFVFTISINAQKTMSDLNSKHKKVVKEFLLKNKNYSFLSENKIDKNYLEAMRKGFGKSFTPYYQIADFNNDKVLDFALNLQRSGKPIYEGKDMSKEHRFRQRLALVIFNGQPKGGFKRIFLEKLETP